MTDRLRLNIALEQIQFARRYTLSLLTDLTTEDWFAMPAAGVSHIGWQVGHLAMAQYGLTMLRLRGKQPADAEWISNDFIRRFQKGSTPSADAGSYPDPDTIRQTLDVVHQHCLQELPQYTDEDLDVKLPEPHAVFDTKLGSVFFCPAHEMLHAGQIGLLRRLLGKAPLR